MDSTNILTRKKNNKEVFIQDPFTEGGKEHVCFFNCFGAFSFISMCCPMHEKLLITVYYMVVEPIFVQTVCQQSHLKNYFSYMKKRGDKKTVQKPAQ